MPHFPLSVFRLALINMSFYFNFSYFQLSFASSFAFKIVLPHFEFDMSDEESNSSSRSSESWIRSKRPKSKFDEFFEIIQASQIGVCKLCQHKKVEIKMKNRNTSGLRKHLLSFHEKESQIFLPVRKQTISQSGDITSFLSAKSRQVRKKMLVRK